MNVCVLDMQPISPPVGGGRLRLLGLYHALGANLPATYVGTYDWLAPWLNGSQYDSEDFQTELKFLGLAHSPAIVRNPECNGIIERFNNRKNLSDAISHICERLTSLAREELP